MIDLHLHLDGSLRPYTVAELLKAEGEQGIEITGLKQILTVGDDCKNLNDYLKAFDYPVKVLQKRANIVRAFFELGEDLHEEGVTYAEIRFAPLLSINQGLSIDEVVEAAIEGVKSAEHKYPSLRLGIILCCMRGDFHKQNLLTVEAAIKYLGEYVCALDLAGAEALFATDKFEEEFMLARKYDIPFTIHAGEAAGPESIWKALEYGAVRIGHGIRCIEDDVLVEYLARHEIPLEVCPISNMQTRVFGDMEEYPLKELLQRGVHATLNTDNRTVSNTNIQREREFIKRYCRISDKDIELMDRYAEKAAFLA